MEMHVWRQPALSREAHDRRCAVAAAATALFLSRGPTACSGVDQLSGSTAHQDQETAAASHCHFGAHLELPPRSPPGAHPGFSDSGELRAEQKQKPAALPKAFLREISPGRGWGSDPDRAVMSNRTRSRWQIRAGDDPAGESGGAPALPTFSDRPLRVPALGPPRGRVGASDGWGVGGAALTLEQARKEAGGEDGADPTTEIRT